MDTPVTKDVEQPEEDNPVLKLVMDIMTANSTERYNIQHRLFVKKKAEHDAIQIGVYFALNQIPFGGTTAQYEDGLAAIALALRPSQEILDFYQDRAERWVQGENIDNVIHPSHRRSGNM